MRVRPLQLTGTTHIVIPALFLVIGQTATLAVFFVFALALTLLLICVLVIVVCDL
jgi:hypothetical protein